MVIKQVTNIYLAASEKIIEADDLVAFVQEPFAKMRADKARTAGDQDSIQFWYSLISRFGSIAHRTTIARACNI